MNIQAGGKSRHSAPLPPKKFEFLSLTVVFASLTRTSLSVTTRNTCLLDIFCLADISDNFLASFSCFTFSSSTSEATCWRRGRGRERGAGMMA